jgi:Ni/Co efflux regulator RcnB
MRKLILTALMAAVAVPAAAVSTPAAAQSWRDVREERRDVREERRELERAYRSGNPRRIREERRDLREERREYRDALNDRRFGRDDWRGYRQQNRDLYRGGRWNSPFAYQGFRPGARIAPNYFGQRYWINDPYRYRLPGVGRHQRWVRHYDDVILVDTRRGRVIDVQRGFYW